MSETSDQHSEQDLAYDMTPEKALRLLGQFVENEADESSDGYPLRSMLMSDVAFLREYISGLLEQLEAARDTLERIAVGSDYTWGNLARLALEKIGAGSSAAVEDGASYNAGHHETVGERQGRQPAPMFDPHPLGLMVDANGYVWRVYKDYYSLCPTRPEGDNDTITEPLTFYKPDVPDASQVSIPASKCGPDCGGDECGSLWHTARTSSPARSPSE